MEAPGCTAPYINNTLSWDPIFLLFLCRMGECLQEPLYLLARKCIKLKLIIIAGLVVQAKSYTRSGFGMHFEGGGGVDSLLKITRPLPSLCASLYLNKNITQGKYVSSHRSKK